MTRFFFLPAVQNLRVLISCLQLKTHSSSEVWYMYFFLDLRMFFFLFEAELNIIVENLLQIKVVFQ